MFLANTLNIAIRQGSGNVLSALCGLTNSTVIALYYNGIIIPIL